MVIFVKETKPLWNEKAELMRKLDRTDNYSKDEAERNAEIQKDNTRIGEIESEIKKITARYIEQAADDLNEALNIEMKDYSVKDLKKILHNKYHSYKELAITSRELYGQLVEKKKEGVVIGKLFKKEAPKEKIEEEILRY